MIPFVISFLRLAQFVYSSSLGYLINIGNPKVSCEREKSGIAKQQGKACSAVKLDVTDPVVATIISDAHIPITGFFCS